MKLRQSHAEFVRLYGDQFKRHEDQGFLHPHTPLAFKLFITHSFRKPTTLWVKHWLEDLENEAVIHENVQAPAQRPERRGPRPRRCRRR